MLQDFAATHALERARGAELLDQIGPAIVMTNSAGGPAGWVTADARPGLVKAIVAVEVLTAFFDNPDLGVSLDWGLAACPLTYDPPVSDPAELRSPDSRHKLVNLQGVPIRDRHRRGVIFRPWRRRHRGLPAARWL
jgi:pimeloyl-ACP methyl ester carboxylesterase